MTHLLDPRRWRRLDTLLDGALQRPPAERLAFLRHATDGDEELFGDACALLERVAEAERVLGESVAELAAPLLRSSVGAGSPANEAMAWAGRVVGPYRVLEEIGRGGMGVVYRARDTRLDRVVALKFLPPDLGGARDAKRRLLEEAKAASAMDHPNVATLHEIGETDDGQLYLVMACYTGETLRDRLSRGPLTPADAVEVARQIGAGLSAAHARGVIHRDIKPGNILLTTDGWAKILDFGVATMAGGDASPARVRIGTVAYMSPEQLRGDGLDSRTDLWSLGVVFYEMLTGERPFPGSGEAAVIRAILDDPPPLEHETPPVPDSLKPILARSLAKDPADRHSSAAELERELEDAQHANEEAAASQRRLRRLRPLRRPWGGRRGGAGGARSEGSAPGRSGRGGRAAVVVVVVALLLAAAWVAGRQAEPPVGSRPPAALAVLPFLDLDAEEGVAYFGDGIMEDILMKLSGVGDLRVVSRTSVMGYRGTTKPLRQIAEELGVGHILEGSVQHGAGRIRINVKLVDARTDRLLWAQAYDRRDTDVLAVQGEIADRIATALRARLTPAERRRLVGEPTRDGAAYDLYLQGLTYLHRYRREDNEVAIDLFRQAVAVDSTFALAHARQAMAMALKVFQYGEPYRWADSSLATAVRAVALEPELAEAHLAVGLAHMAREQYEAALEGFERAVVLSPSYAGAMINTGVVKWRLGSYDQALPWYRRALDHGPVDRAIALSTMAGVYAFLALFEEAESAVAEALSLQPDLPIAHLNAVLLRLVQGRDDEAVAQGARLLTTSPGNARAWATAGTAYQFSGDLARARDHYERAYEISSTSFDLLWRPVTVLLAHTLWIAGERGRAMDLLEEYQALARQQVDAGNEGPFVRYNLAAVHSILGRQEEALRWLADAVDRGRKEHLFLARDPLFDNVRSEPGFRRIVAENVAEMDRQRRRVLAPGP